MKWQAAVAATTLALDIAEEREAVYLDLELWQTEKSLVTPTYFSRITKTNWLFLNEIHRMPVIFQTLLGLIDQGRWKGLKAGRFLILRSAFIDLLRQSGETLAGRIILQSGMSLYMGDTFSFTWPH